MTEALKEVVEQIQHLADSLAQKSRRRLLRRSWNGSKSLKRSASGTRWSAHQNPRHFLRSSRLRSTEKSLLASLKKVAGNC